MLSKSNFNIAINYCIYYVISGIKLKAFIHKQIEWNILHKWLQLKFLKVYKNMYFSLLIKLISNSKMMEKAMAPHSSTLAWKIPWTEQPGRLQSMGSLRVGHDWATSLSLSTSMHWRRKWHPTPVFLSGESQGRGSLVGCCLWGRTESDTTEAT